MWFKNCFKPVIKPFGFSVVLKTHICLKSSFKPTIGPEILNGMCNISTFC